MVLGHPDHRLDRSDLRVLANYGHSKDHLWYIQEEIWSAWEEVPVEVREGPGRVLCFFGALKSRDLQYNGVNLVREDLLG